MRKLIVAAFAALALAGCATAPLSAPDVASKAVCTSGDTAFALFQKDVSGHPDLAIKLEAVVTDKAKVGDFLTAMGANPDMGDSITVLTANNGVSRVLVTKGGCVVGSVFLQRDDTNLTALIGPNVEG